ncbi:MAG TPA: hypothetical protein VGV92_06730 [Gammaproteobacteria bacterium]|nr:hypothetical protein [Gammaproteobacteria bacterium]
MRESRSEQGGKAGLCAGLLATSYAILASGVRSNHQMVLPMVFATFIFNGGGYLFGRVAGFAYGQMESAYYSFFQGEGAAANRQHQPNAVAPRARLG